MTDSHKTCPICEAQNHRNAMLCATCGTTLAEVAPKEKADDREARADLYDYRFGETDLAEASLAGRGRFLSGLLIALLLVAAGVLTVAVYIANQMQDAAAIASAMPSASPTRLMAPSITPGTPTATFTISPVPSPEPSETFTPSPCVRRVAAGDSLIAIILRCGHRNLDILPTVMALNDIADETRIQIGQEISVPRPSPSVDPASTPEPAFTSAPEDSASAPARDDELTRLAFDPFAPTLTPTLLPGLMWYDVQADDDMIYVAAIHDISIKTLADLNPEISFNLCDFGEVYGGPECTVQLFVNQRIRVPAPTPTATSIATASGSETPTPSPTATFNAPVAQSPAGEAFFSPYEQVTLRWVGTGSLSQGQVYRITLINTDSGERFAADTQELFFIIPSEWQSPEAGSHRYSWQVSIAESGSATTSYTTASRAFVWQGKGQADA